MTIVARIEAKPATVSGLNYRELWPSHWDITLATDQANSIAFKATSLTINNANGKFRMHAKGADGGHLAAMVDIVIGPEDPKDYAAMTGAVQ